PSRRGSVATACEPVSACARFTPSLHCAVGNRLEPQERPCLLSVVKYKRPSGPCFASRTRAPPASAPGTAVPPPRVRRSGDESSAQRTTRPSARPPTDSPACRRTDCPSAPTAGRERRITLAELFWVLRNGP